MSSTNYGKNEVCFWVRTNIEQGSSCLDVGACDGKWFELLGGWLKMDGVEIYEPNVKQYNLEEKYEQMFVCDIKDLKYKHYDLVIFGDVIEHMTVETAQEVLRYASEHADNLLVGVPFMWEQGAIYGNKWEEHIQDDLTERIFHERYEGFEPLFVGSNYGYFTKSKKIRVT